MKQRTYTELIALPTFRERFLYAKLDGVIGDFSFGGDRWLNQEFYKSEKWKAARMRAILRDEGCDLAVPGYIIPDEIRVGKTIVRGQILVHHLNPITIRDVEEDAPCLYDLENLVCVSKDTHEAIHWANEGFLPREYTERTPNDQCPWKG